MAGESRAASNTAVAGDTAGAHAVGGRAVGAAVLALAAFVAIGAFFIDGQAGYAGISPRAMPLAVAAGLALCGLGLVLRHDGLPRIAPESDGQPAQLGRLGWLLAGLVLNIALIGAIGFPLAGVLLMVCAARGFGSERPLRDALVALVLTLALWAVFTRLLAINLPLLPLLGI